MSWMYNLVKDEDKIRLCEIYFFDGEIGYFPVSWLKLFKHPIMIIKNLLWQRRIINIIPSGEFITEQIFERLTYE